ncbi:hypothetical protein [Rheinheimera hassiensis]|uniref:hypothetical protein n=1 Tax=Rheinheimera hassiensis TaxID=1193627 RepID=UPI001F070CDE|nr:hypothetical protein [Rheinheimera hassiensis]
MKPAQYPTTADAASANTLGTTASPLLAGFSMTLIALISGSTSPETIMKFPEATLAALLCATILFILSVQFTVVARKYNLTQEEFKKRTLSMNDTDRAQAYGIAMEDFCFWIDRARLVFSFGLGLLFLGLAGVMLPPSPTCPRILIVSVPVLFIICEMVWIVYDIFQSHQFRKTLGSE